MDKRSAAPRLGGIAALLAVLACSNVLPPLPGTPAAIPPQVAETAIYLPPTSTAPLFEMTVQATTALTVRTGPGEIYQVVVPMAGQDPYFLHGETIFLIHDEQPPCQADSRGNWWVHVGSDRGIFGWAAAWYEGEFLIYPLPKECK